MVEAKLGDQPEIRHEIDTGARRDIETRIEPAEIPNRFGKTAAYIKGELIGILRVSRPDDKQPR